MLVGEKGSGKTLLAREVCIRSQLPVILICSSYTGDDFNSFMASITQPAIILLDEFEKVYDKGDQEKILTLLDGTFQSEKLFLFTSNSKYDIDPNLKNRPGRIFYLIDFCGVNEEFIREYCMDNLTDKGKINDIVNVSSKFEPFNFDMLAAFVEEINRYGELPDDIIPVLNAKPEYVGRSYYKIVNLKMAGVSIPVTRQFVEINPAVNGFRVGVVFHWDVEKAKQQSLLNQLESAVYNEEPDPRELFNFVEKGVLIPGRASTEDDDDDDNNISSATIFIYFEPSDILSYELGMTNYSHENGWSVSLIKTKKSGRNW